MLCLSQCSTALCRTSSRVLVIAGLGAPEQKSVSASTATCKCAAAHSSASELKLPRWRVGEESFPHQALRWSRRSRRQQPALVQAASSDESEPSTSTSSSRDSEPGRQGQNLRRHLADGMPELSSPDLSASEKAKEGRPGSASGLNEAANTPYWLITGLALVGAAETAYLTFEKLLGGSVACPVGGSCSGVLDSPWGTLLGLPLALFGFLAYSSTALLAQAARSSAHDQQAPARWLLLGATSGMAATSAYLMYILFTELEGTSCAYCVASAILSTTLLLLTLRGFRREELQSAVAAQAGVAAAVVVGLSVAFSDARSALAGSEYIDLPPIAPEVSTVSTTPAVALAKHLKAVGAKMYGAFWCSHCHEQKQMFGKEAMQYVSYVECYPDGYRQGVTIAPACTDANIQGFPTWIINGKAIPGEQDFDQLAKASEFDASSITN